MSSSGAPPPTAGSAGQTFRAKRELDEARKSGILPPEKDSVTGELINPHIPAFMAQAPWYLSQGGAPTLAHQRKEEAARSGFETFYRRGEFTGQAAASRQAVERDALCGDVPGWVDPRGDGTPGHLASLARAPECWRCVAATLCNYRDKVAAPSP